MRNNDNLIFPWSGPTRFGQAAGQVDALSLIQSNFGNPGNLEVVARIGDRLALFWRDSGPSFAWSGPFFFGAVGATGNPRVSLGDYLLKSYPPQREFVVEFENDDGSRRRKIVNVLDLGDRRFQLHRMATSE